MTEIQKDLVINIVAAIAFTLVTHYAIKPLKASKLLNKNNTKE
jgi:uncharacterized membrane protein YwzB